MPVPFRVVSLGGEVDLASIAAQAVRAAGHLVAAQVDAPQDDLAHEALQARGFRGITLLCGGQEPAAIVAAVRGQLDRELVGVAELYRQRLLPAVGPRAALAELCCGPAGDGVLVAVPGGSDELTVALAELLLPLAELLVPPVAEPPPATPGGLQVQQMGAEAGPGGAAEPGGAAGGGSGWEAGLLAMGGRLERGRFPPLPEVFERLAPARNVLDTAGERGLVTLPDGRVYAAFGFPDLLRGRSKVLLIAEGEPLAEVIALHRHPRRVGVTTHGPSAWLPSADLDPDGPALERTGATCPSFGTLFAVEGGAVFYTRDRKVHGWDGRNEREEGTPAQVLASLLLRWSQR